MSLNSCSAWSSVLLAGAVQLLTPSFAQAAELDRPIFTVPITSVAIDLDDEQLQLWIEGDRCDLPLEVVQESEELDGFTEVQIYLTQTVSASNCPEETVPFTLPLNVQQSIESGNLYRVLVNDYDFTIDVTNR